MNINLLEHYVLLFFIGSTLGWCMEVTCKLFEFHRFINRGFLIGPYCPVYGFGAVLVTLLLSRHADSPVAVFVLAIALCGTLEYLTSYFMEKLFHARWWDYSRRRFNLNGRICANTLIPFGLLGLGMVYGVKPLFFSWMDRIPTAWMHGLCIGLVTLILIDTAISATVLGHVRKTAELTGGDDTEILSRSVREILLKQNVLIRRLMQAFPYAKLYNRQLREKLKRIETEMREDVERKQKEVREEIQRREAQIRAELKSRRH